MPNDDAHRILSIYAYFRKAAGDTLGARQFLAVGLRRRWSAEQLDNGLQDAFRQGWLERAGEEGWRLTEPGFKEAAAA